MSVDSFLPEMITPTTELGNASNRPYTFVYDSVVMVWNPGEVKVVEELMGPPVDKWGQPTKISKDLYEVVPNGLGAHGEKVVPRRLLVTKLGGSLKELLTKIFSDPGCPLYPVKNDGQDEARARIAENKYRKVRIPKAHATIEDHRARCQRDYNAGLLPTPKPSHVREAEQDIDLFARTVKAGQGRYIVRKDGDSFDFLDDAQAHVLKNWPELEGTWRSIVMDNVGGPNAFRTGAPRAPEGQQVSATVPPPVSQSAATKGILHLAEKSGKLLDPALVARLDGPDSEAAVEEAMDAILSPQNKEEKARARVWNAENGPKDDA